MNRTLSKQIRATEPEYSLLKLMRVTKVDPETVKRMVLQEIANLETAAPILPQDTPEPPAQDETPAEEKKAVSCPRCGSAAFMNKEHPNHPGKFADFCVDCGRWLKWTKPPKEEPNE